MPTNELLHTVRRTLAPTRETSTSVRRVARVAANIAELVLKHRLDGDAPIAASMPAPECVVEEMLEEPRGRNRSLWRGALANAVALTFGCQAYYAGRELRVVGRRAEVEAAEYLYTFLVGEIKRLGEEAAARKIDQDGELGDVPRAWHNAFRQAAVQAIAKRLTDARDAFPEAAALGERDAGEVEAYLHDHGIEIERIGGAWRANVGQTAGVEAGATMKIHPDHKDA